MVGIDGVILVALVSIIAGILLHRWITTRISQPNDLYRRERHWALAVAAAIVLLFIIVAMLPLFLRSFQMFTPDANAGLLAKLGTYGDMFGLFNSFFTGLAFAGIFYTVLIQYRQRELQEEEIILLKAKSAELTISDRDDNKLFTKVPGTGKRLFNSCYIRVCIENSKETIAKGCRAYLTAIEIEQNGSYVKVPFFENAHRLRWSLEDEHNSAQKEEIDIPNRVPMHLNVFSIKDERHTPDNNTGCNAQISLIQIANKHVKYHIYDNKLLPNTGYRFEIMISAENAKTMIVSLIVRLKVDWNEVYIVSVRTGEVRS